LACDPVDKGSKPYTYKYEGIIKTGESTGPLGRTTHYKNVPMTAHSITPREFRCKNCDKLFPPLFSKHLPKVSFHNDGNTTVMMIDEGFLSPLPICSKPHLGGDLKMIWETGHCSLSWSAGLEAMWSAARQLDRNSKIYTQEPIEELIRYKVSKPGYCILL
jgi:hypothetical protein